MPDYSTILFEVKDNVAHLTFNRPEAANSLNSSMDDSSLGDTREEI